MERLLTLEDVADYFGLSEKTIRRYVSRGILTAIQPGGRGSAVRFDPKEVTRVGRQLQGDTQPDQANAKSTKEQKPLRGRPPQWLKDKTDNSGDNR